MNVYAVFVQYLRTGVLKRRHSAKVAREKQRGEREIGSSLNQDV